MPPGVGAERERPRVAGKHFSGVRDAAPADGHSPGVRQPNGRQIAHTSDTRLWLTTADAARALGVSPSTVRRRIADGQLTARREPHRRSFRWLVLLPGDPTTPPLARPVIVEAGNARDAEIDRAALAVVREADDELRAIAARVDLTRHAVVSVLERERAIALRQATLLEELAGDPCAVVPATTVDTAASDPPAEGSRRALLIGLLVCIATTVSSALLALPGWSGGIVGAVAVVAGLIAAVEAYLVVTAWLGGLRRRNRESA
jgi:excisionase family DNA binding protein